MSPYWPNWPATGEPATPRSPPPSTGMSQRCGAGSTSCAALACCTSTWTSTTGCSASTCTPCSGSRSKPARLAEAGQAIAAHPEIPFAAATTGPTNLVASALFRDTRHLYEYLTGELAGLPGVSSVQTAPIIRTLKRTASVH